MGAAKKVFKYISKKLVTAKTSGKKYTRYFYEKRSAKKALKRRKKAADMLAKRKALRKLSGQIRKR